MADVIPLIPKSGQIWIHTGNIVNWNRLKRKLTQTATEELSECITSTLNSWLERADRTELQYTPDVECMNEKFVETLSEQERPELKVTVKIFLNSPSPEAVKEAVERTCSELGIKNLETVLISLPDKHQTLESLQTVWQTLERLVEAEQIYRIGTADLDKPQLEQLYEWGKVKPYINQVNLESCCVIPADMVEYAKQNDIQLLTHNDPKEILTEKKFQELLSSSLTSRDSEGWEPSWVVRYSVLIRSRGIIKTKGYIVKGLRDIKKRN